MRLTLQDPGCPRRAADGPHTRTRGRVAGALLAGGLLALGAVSAPAALAAGPFSQCPAVGADTTGCGLLITINPNGSITTAASGQGPYEKADDTLVGIQNNTPIKIGALTLSGGPDAGGNVPFAFDGDGLCSGSNGTFTWTPPAGCPFSTIAPFASYAGPGTSVSNVSPNKQSGTISFAGSIAPGGSAYFSLESSVSADALTIPGPPMVTITTPANGATYTLGSVPNANYTCTEGAGGPGLASCTGPVPNGSPIDGTSGSHCFTVTAVSNDGESSSATNCYTVTLPTTSLTFNGGGANGNSFSGDFHDATPVSATLRNTSKHPATPLGGKPVTFTLNGSETCFATTTAAGVAMCSITPGEAAGTYPLKVSFGGDAADLGSSSTGSFTVIREQTTLTADAPAQVSNGSPATLTGRLTEDGVTPIQGRPVGFTLGSGATAQSCSATTDASGHASCLIANVNQPAAATSVAVADSFAGDAFYLPANASRTAKLLFYTGRADDAGLTLNVLFLHIGPLTLNDTGAISTSQASNTSNTVANLPLGLANLTLLNAGNSVVTGHGVSTSTATTGSENAALLLLPVITSSQVTATSSTTCAGSTGTTQIASLVIGGTTVVGPGGLATGTPAPNTTLSVAGVTVILNEQIPIAGGLSVNAIHLKVLGVLDLVVSSAESDIHNCS